MAQVASTLKAARMEMPGQSGILLRSAVICLTAFLTVVDLFATQAILPSLTQAYHVTPAAMGFAVNSSTMGMAVAGLVVSLFSQRIDRRLGILISLALLSIPTALLAIAPDLTTFTALRIAQGLCMASAFTLTLAYLGEECSAADAAGAFAAYITGNVASNLIGRLVSAAVADHLGLASNFYFFAVLNLAGAVLVYYTVAQTTPMVQMGPTAHSPFTAWTVHLRNPRLRGAFGIGFCILFAFIGTFTYVNFVLVRPPLSLGPMELGFVYFVFLPSVVTTLLAGRAVHRWAPP
jgi:MFS transporter, YNFM family, putative membrane transport protein